LAVGGRGIVCQFAKQLGPPLLSGENWLLWQSQFFTFQAILPKAIKFCQIIAVPIFHVSKKFPIMPHEQLSLFNEYKASP
jgi:hypothetical protein